MAEARQLIALETRGRRQRQGVFGRQAAGQGVDERLDRDPFLLEGIVVERTIRPYTPVLGSQAPTFAEHLER